MPSEVRGETLRCFNRLWEYRMDRTGDFCQYFSSQDNELQFTYKWFSRDPADNLGCARLWWNIGVAAVQTFMPHNPVALCTLLKDDSGDPIAHFENILRHVLVCRDRTFKTRVLYAEYVVPALVCLFGIISPLHPLSAVQYPSMLGNIWLVISQFKHYKTCIDASRNKRLNRRNLECIYNILIDRCRKENSERDTCCLAGYLFGRIANLCATPHAFIRNQESLIEIFEGESKTSGEG